MAELSKGDRVSWVWGQGRAYGEVAEVHTEKVTRTLKGSQITRNGSAEDPALLLRQEDGTEVLKLASEVEQER
jgi:hypothetical protein